MNEMGIFSKILGVAIRDSNVMITSVITVIGIISLCIIFLVTTTLDRTRLGPELGSGQN